MQNSGLETSVLPLVARCVSSALSAQTAAAGEGADLLILDVNDKDKNAGTFVKEVCDRISIPVFLDTSGSGADSPKAGLDLLQDGANGLVLNTVDIRKAGEGDLLTDVSSLLAAISVAIERRKEMEISHSSDTEVQSRDDDVDVDVEDGGAFLGLPEDVVTLNVDMEEQSVTKLVKQIVNEERVLLTAMVDFVKDASPDVSIKDFLKSNVLLSNQIFDLHIVVGHACCFAVANPMLAAIYDIYLVVAISVNIFSAQEADPLVIIFAYLFVFHSSRWRKFRCWSIP